ncbi:MAG: CHAT domain-containing tetratricopeptide repeat protein [FCB group bacterium]|jgi:CHAT domain-containing protein/Flp pilus assembly protein TadD
MKKSLKFAFFSLFILHSTFYISKAQTWQQMMDSTNFYTEKEDFQTGLQWAKQALPLVEKKFGKLDTNYTSTLGNYAQLLYYFGKLDSAIFYQEIQLKLCRTIFKGDHPNLAMSINNMAAFYEVRGRFAETEPLLKEALEMNRRLFKGDHPDLATSINNMASFYNDWGRYAEAEPLYKEALEMRKHLFKGDHPDLASSINHMAGFYEGRGCYADAEPLYKESLEMYRRLFKGDHPDLAMSINYMAGFYEGRGRYAEAEPLYKEALEMARRLYKGNHPNLANLINNMAGFYKDRGLYAEAEPLYKESLEMYRRLFKGDHPDLAMSINNMAVFYKDRGRYAEAEPLYKEALEMYRCLFKGDHPDLAKSINNMAGFYDDRERYTEAEPLFLEGLQVYLNILNNYFPSLSESEKLKFFNEYKPYFDGFYKFAINRYKDNPQILCKMCDYNLYTKSLIFNSASKTKRSILNSNDTLLITKYKQWLDMRSFLGKLYNMTSDEVKKKNFNIDSIEKTANELEKELSLKSEAYTQSYEKKKYDWKKIQAFLKPDEAAVETIRIKMNAKKRMGDTTQVPDTVYYAFLIITEQTDEHPDIVISTNAKELETDSYDYYTNSIQFKTDDKESFYKYWSALYENTKNYKKIYFSPEGVYNNINPATLLMPNGKFLIEEQDIQFINSTKDILLDYYRTKQESNMLNSAVLIGNPTFDLSSEKLKKAEKELELKRESKVERSALNLSPLPGTEIEIKNIGNFLKSKKWQVSSYTKDKAIKSVLENTKNPRVVHIATHGLFMPDIERKEDDKDNAKLHENPLLRSGLFFAGANKYNKTDNMSMESEDGLLTAYEAMNLDLDKTELVVLSACETGLGEIQNGEGVFGLRRAFQQAGARTVMMSLWKVNDEATQDLMSAFYKNWVTGMTKREAFSKAQQEIRRKYISPYYWGAFVMVGE